MDKNRDRSLQNRDRLERFFFGAYGVFFDFVFLSFVGRFVGTAVGVPVKLGYFAFFQPGAKGL